MKKINKRAMVEKETVRKIIVAVFLTLALIGAYVLYKYLTRGI